MTLREELAERHWSYMDRYAAQLIARGGHLVLGLGSGDPVDLEPPADRDALIAYGPLLSDDATAWLGTAALVRTPDPAAVLTVDRYAAVEVHDWHFGGRV